MLSGSPEAWFRDVSHANSLTKSGRATTLFEAELTAQHGAENGFDLASLTTFPHKRFWRIAYLRMTSHSSRRIMRALTGKSRLTLGSLSSPLLSFTTRIRAR